jgi:hypothetical protein
MAVLRSGCLMRACALVAGVAAVAVLPLRASDTDTTSHPDPCADGAADLSGGTGTDKNPHDTAELVPRGTYRLKWGGPRRAFLFLTENRLGEKRFRFVVDRKRVAPGMGHNALHGSWREDPLDVGEHLERAALLLCGKKLVTVYKGGGGPESEIRVESPADIVIKGTVAGDLIEIMSPPSELDLPDEPMDVEYVSRDTSAASRRDESSDW